MLVVIRTPENAKVMHRPGYRSDVFIRPFFTRSAILLLSLSLYLASLPVNYARVAVSRNCQRDANSLALTLLLNSCFDRGPN